MSKFVKWECGVNHGECSLNDCMKSLKEFESKAKEIMISTNSDHVVYGAKFYKENGEIDYFRFYSLTMNDKEFDEMNERLNGVDVVVYALHNRK